MNSSNPPFFIGQRVVCVDDKQDIPFSQSNGKPFLLKKGDVYTISWEEGECYHLVETDKVNPTYCYRKSRFAPIPESYADETAKIAESFTEVIEQHDQKERIKPERVVLN